MPRSLFMVVERFRDGGARPVYERFRERGRLAPPGVTYVASWVDVGLDRCFQLMEAEDRALLDEWIQHWHDLVEFEVCQVITSAEASARVLGTQAASHDHGAHEPSAPPSRT
jgi:hypothetical protein